MGDTELTSLITVLMYHVDKQLTIFFSDILTLFQIKNIKNSTIVWVCCI